MKQSTLFLLATSVLALVLVPVGTAYASKYVFDYSKQTSTIQVPSVALQGGNEGSSTISSVAADAATVTVSSPTYPYYVKLNLTNSQSSPTVAGFQQKITFNPATYSSYEASDLGNIRFCADVNCATALNAWLESVMETETSSSCSPSATSAIAWVKLPSRLLPTEHCRFTCYSSPKASLMECTGVRHRRSAQRMRSMTTVQTCLLSMPTLLGHHYRRGGPNSVRERRQSATASASQRLESSRRHICVIHAANNGNIHRNIHEGCISRCWIQGL